MGRNVKFLWILLLVGVFFSSCGNDSNEILNENTTGSTTENTTSSTTDETKGTTTSNVIFEDNFDQTDGIPDKTKWILTGPVPTSSWAKYFSGSYDQAYVKNGNLVLKAEKINGTYKVAAIRSQGKFDFTYGKVEARARITAVQGGWAAIWMWPSIEPTLINDGEIDIMEQVNHETKVYQTVHSYYTYVLKQNDPIHQISVPFNVNEYNIYAVDWTPDKITFSVNGKTTLTYPNMHLKDEANKKQWPFNKMFYLYLDYKLGETGTWPNGIDDSQLPGYMEIDWIKVTQSK